MSTRTTICIDKGIYGEMKEKAEQDFIHVSQLIRQMWRDHKSNVLGVQPSLKNMKRLPAKPQATKLAKGRGK